VYVCLQADLPKRDKKDMYMELNRLRSHPIQPQYNNNNNKNHDNINKCYYYNNDYHLDYIIVI